MLAYALFEKLRVGRGIVDPESPSLGQLVVPKRPQHDASVVLSTQIEIMKACLHVFQDHLSATHYPIMVQFAGPAPFFVELSVVGTFRDSGGVLKSTSAVISFQRDQHGRVDLTHVAVPVEVDFGDSFVDQSLTSGIVGEQASRGGRYGIRWYPRQISRGAHEFVDTYGLVADGCRKWSPSSIGGERYDVAGVGNEDHECKNEQATAGVLQQQRL